MSSSEQSYASVASSTMLTGTFILDGKTRTMRWSDELFYIHGYHPGDVVPTLALTLAHKHPDDLPRIQAINEELFAHGGPVAIYHRLVDAQSHVHKVVTAGEAVLDEAGNLATVSGVMLDLTSTIEQETRLASREAIRGAMETRGTIAKAQGILMGRLGIASDEAFKILATFSNNRNTKLAGVAALLVAVADNPASSGALGALIRELRQARPHSGRQGGRQGS